jgi:RHS repeat-associated protein
VNNVEQSLLLAEIADQRYYNSNAGRFYTPDPGGIKTADPKNPTSWNRYAYAGGDPVNRYDPYGLYDCDPSTTCSPTPSGPSISIDGGSPIGQIYYGCDYYCAIGQAAAAAALLAYAAQQQAAALSCNISVASSGRPRDGQNLVGLTNYSPLTNTLGRYSTIGRPGGGPQGWFFAVQIQANLSGDTNPLDWVPTQSVSTTGSVSVTGRDAPISGTIPAHPDNPGFGINQGTVGRLDWLDEPGFPNMEFGARVTSANLTDSFTSTVTNARTGQSCTTNWSVHFTDNNGRWNFIFGQP